MAIKNLRDCPAIEGYQAPKSLRDCPALEGYEAPQQRVPQADAYHQALVAYRIAQGRRKNQSPGLARRIRNSTPQQQAPPRRRSQRLAAKPKVSYTV